MRDDQSYEVLKVGNSGKDKHKSISKIAFLELKKYDPEIKTEYNRKRWLGSGNYNFIPHYVR